MQVPVFLRAVILLAAALVICTVQAQTQPETESAPAKLNALSRVQLSSELAARITEVRVRAGNHFKKGDLLARFDCTELKAELEGAESQRALARRQLEANISLRQLGGNISELEMVQSEAQLADATAKRKVLAHRNTYCDVHAPFAGFVVSRQIEPHQRVEIGTPLFELVDNRGLEVEAIIPSGWLDKLSVGAAFRVTINETGREYNAVLQRIVPVVDPVTRTVRVIGQLEEHPQNFSSTLLISGMSGEAHFALPDQSDDMLADRTHSSASEGAN
ncbi:efflux RND transporter periplasmic adaptor subunit [Microbulbifer elongatus]|uniref:efflux RND transporter periplasmic adaptor subunit n=1 Tax=Microbulbifer elongatus TaxID=86173 RepID=UPI001CFE0231|nr:efflux RND transporter periplasmic adaptor subunit [Microbulbifer elongatus]